MRVISARNQRRALDIFSPGSFAAFLQVIAIDLVLAGDNAVVVGMAAAGLPPAEQRRKVILIGIAAATVLRIGLAFVAMNSTARDHRPTLAGGLLLLWVAWKFYQRVATRRTRETRDELATADEPRPRAAGKPFRQAVVQITVGGRLDVARQRAGGCRRRAATILEVLILGLLFPSR